jgi:hypothetical protein
MRLPTTSYPYGYSNNRHGGSTSVKSHFLLLIPGWEVKTCHCTRHTMHCSATDHPRGRIRQGPYPAIPETRPYPLTIDPPRPVLHPTSNQPRPTASQQGRKADVTQDPKSFHRLILYVTMVSRDGRPFLGHVATATSTAINKTSPQRHPRRPCLLLPYKRADMGSTRGRRTTDDEKPVSIPPKKINISSNHLCTLTFSLRPGLGSLSHSL